MPSIFFNKKSNFLKTMASYLNWHHVTLFLILILAVFLRFYQLDKQIWWMGGDDARDMLVVRHIVEYGEKISRGPLALGGLNWLKNSPVYYYFVAFLWLLANSAKGLMYLWAALFTLPILLAYLIVKKISNKKSALLAALIFSINPRMIDAAKNLSQAHLSIIFSTFFIYFLFNYLSNKKNKLLNLLGMIGAAFLPFHFHYNIILVFPSFLFLIVVCYWQLKQKEKKIFSLNSLLPILLALFLFFSWLILTRTMKVFDQFVFLNINNSLSDSNLSSIIFVLRDSFLVLLKSVWGEMFARAMIIPSIVLLLFLIFKKHLLPHSFLKKGLNYLFLILSSIFLISFYHGYIEDTYFLFILPVLLILLSLALIFLLKTIKYYAWPIIILIIYLMFLSSIKSNFGTFFPVPVYEKKELLAETIARDYAELYPFFDKKTEQPQFLLTWDSQVFIYMSDAWGTPGVWFHLEDIFQQQLVELINYGPNSQSIIENPRVIYTVCHYHHDYAKIDNCLNNLSEKYPVAKADVYQLYKDEELALFRAEIKMSLGAPLVNDVHYY